MKIVAYFNYDLDALTSYKLEDYIEELFAAKGDKIVRLDEVRDHLGYLKQFRVEVEIK